MLAAIANLTMHEELFEKVVPHDQSFEDYAGTVFENHRKSLILYCELRLYFESRQKLTKSTKNSPLGEFLKT